MRWRSIEISFLTLDCHLWWNAKIQKSILSMKCQIYYNYEDESWPSGSQERRKDRLLRWSILHVPCSLAANLRAILVRGVFRHYVSLCSNKFLLEYLTLESDNNTSVSIVKRLVGWSGNAVPGVCELTCKMQRPFPAPLGAPSQPAVHGLGKPSSGVAPCWDDLPEIQCPLASALCWEGIYLPPASAWSQWAS